MIEELKKKESFPGAKPKMKARAKLPEPEIFEMQENEILKDVSSEYDSKDHSFDNKKNNIAE